MAGGNEPRNVQTPHLPKGEAEGSFPISGYVVLNLIFWAFCTVEVLLVRAWLKEIQGVVFFFIILALGFLAVSVFDCVYDRLSINRPTDSSMR